MNIIPITLGSKAGIQRDGTTYQSNHFVDAKNTRFYHGWPTKILGWEEILLGNSEIVGSTYGIPNSQSYDIYLGRPSSLTFFNITNTGTVSPEVSRTPITGFSYDENNLWSFDSFTINTAGISQSYVVAQVAPNGVDITNETKGGIFYGVQPGATALTPVINNTAGTTPVGPVVCSGGIICAFGLLIALDNNGDLRWCSTETIADLSDWTGYQNIGSTKCCAAVLYQGSLLVWTLSSLYRLTYDATNNRFEVQPLSGSISIWSANSIVEYQNNIFWVGKGQFYQFNGSINRINNLMNNTFFFGAQGVNRNYKGRIYSFVDEQNDEIWHMYPRGQTATQNTHAVIFSPQANVWYDTPIDRSTALSLTTYDYRIMTSSKIYQSIIPGSETIISTYPIWQHEKGYDEVFQGVSYPIEAYFEYPLKDFFTASPSPENNICMETFRIEPDFILEGTMQAYLINRMYAQSTPKVSDAYTFTSTTEKIDIKPVQGRLVSVRFVSNVLGGYFEGGRILHGINKGSAAA